MIATCFVCEDSLLACISNVMHRKKISNEGKLSSFIDCWFMRFKATIFLDIVLSPVPMGSRYECISYVQLNDDLFYLSKPLKTLIRLSGGRAEPGMFRPWP